jgi:SNW domain-containing protein 1
VIGTFKVWNIFKSKGYTIPLDKRLAADGRGLQSVHINENFSKLAEALYIADRKAREAIEMRAKMEKTLAEKEKAKKEDDLKQLASQIREQRSGIKPIKEGLDTTGFSCILLQIIQIIFHF